MKKYINYIFKKINKKLNIGFISKSGRNYTGKICVHHQGGKIKSNYKNIDFYRRINCYGRVYKIIKCSFRTGYIGGILYENGLFSYILISEELKIGQRIFIGLEEKKLKEKIGNTMLVQKIGLFTNINNVEMYPYSGGSLIRAAGTSGMITGKSKIKKKVMLKLKSGWNIIISENCLASIGQVSNMKHKYDIIKKAGKNRKLGVRPTVRGVAMNPCDHPHGGGEGKKSPPAIQVSPWGWITKGGTPSLKKKKDKEKKKLYKQIKKK